MELFDRNGNVLPYEDWEFEPQFEPMFAIDGGNFKADYKALSGGEYYSMILVYDVNGNTYESALMPLQ